MTATPAFARAGSWCCPAPAIWAPRRALRRHRYGRRSSRPAPGSSSPRHRACPSEGWGEVGGAHDGDENLRRTDLAGKPVDDHRHRVAGVIDKQLVAADMGLPHRDRQSRCPTAVQFAEARIAIPLGATLDVLVPQHCQGDVLALELAVNLSPIGLGTAPMALLGAGCREQRRPSALSVISAGNGQLNPALANRFRVNRTVDGATPTRRAISLSPTPAVVKRSTSRTWRIVVLSAGIRSPVQKQKERTLIGPAEAPPNRARSSRNTGRNHLGTPSDIKSECWATSSRIRGRLRPESASPERVASFTGLSRKNNLHTAYAVSRPD